MHYHTADDDSLDAELVDTPVSLVTVTTNIRKHNSSFVELQR